MSWDLQGQQIRGLYLGEFAYTGTVESSRVKLGGQVQHTVVLDQPLQVFGDHRDRILVTVTEILNRPGVDSARV